MNILLIRPHRNDVDATALLAQGISSVSDPFLVVTPTRNAAGAQRMLNVLISGEPCWFVLTSTNALSFFEQALPSINLHEVFRANPHVRFAAIGKQTAHQLTACGVEDVVVAQTSYARSLLEELLNYPPTPVVIPRGSLAMQTLDFALRQAGYDVISEILYDTTYRHETPPSLEAIRRGEFDAVLLRSPSAARAFDHFTSHSSLPVVCAGTTTAEHARSLELNVVLVCEDPDPEAVALDIADYAKGNA